MRVSIGVGWVGVCLPLLRLSLICSVDLSPSRKREANVTSGVCETEMNIEGPHVKAVPE